jgi:hypothetical protein
MVKQAAASALSPEADNVDIFSAVERKNLRELGWRDGLDAGSLWPPGMRRAAIAGQRPEGMRCGRMDRIDVGCFQRQ